ncbi:hypothetical protein B0H13DRAFT_1874279 [Mycena leptocephala]|nr:hypothetical protein B0H13DRAFT_1874279 [Mycena leptocephala]
MGEFDQTIGFTLMGVTVLRILELRFELRAENVPGHHDPWWTRFYCVTNFNNPQIPQFPPLDPSSTFSVTAVLAITNQMFLTWKIYLFTRNKILIGFLTATSLAACGMGVAAAIESWIFSELAKLVALQPIVEGNLALQCAVDVTIAAILTVLLSRSKTSFPKTDKVLDRLIRTAVQSGFFTAIFALGTLFSFRFSPGTYMIALFALPIGRIYTQTMMAHLLSREGLRSMLSNGGNIVSVPNFNVTTVGAGGAMDGTAIMLRTNPTHSSKTSETL